MQVQSFAPSLNVQLRFPVSVENAPQLFYKHQSRTARTPFSKFVGNRSHSSGALMLIAKKEPHAEASFRQEHRSIRDSQTGRLQLLFPQTTSISTLRLDGPAHARLSTDQVVSQIAQSALQTLHCFIRHSLHSQRRSQHLCPVEEIAFQLTTIY